jgi:hypothetical protein
MADKEYTIWQSISAHWPMLSGILGSIGVTMLALYRKLLGTASKEELAKSIDDINDTINETDRRNQKRIDSLMRHGEEQRVKQQQFITELFIQHITTTNRRRDD